MVPADVADAGWTRVTVHASELAALTAGSASVAAGRPMLDMELLTVEVARVEVVRTWLDPALLRSRSWRWRDGSRPPLSDGRDPASGDLPAYVTGVVLARNLTVSPRWGASSWSEGVAFRPAPAGGGGGAAAPRIRPHQLRDYLSAAGSRAVPVFAPEAVTAAARVSDPVSGARLSGPVSVRQEVPVRTDRSDRATGPRVVPAGREVRDHRTPGRPPPGGRPLPPASETERFRGWAERHPPPRGGRPGPRPQAPPPPTPPDPGIQVIGFVCARVPRSPNPDPALDWASSGAALP